MEARVESAKNNNAARTPVDPVATPWSSNLDDTRWSPNMGEPVQRTRKRQPPGREPPASPN
jgi:hypothetical protein